MIGKLDRRVIIERATVTADAFNEPIPAWTTFATVWASRQDVSDGENISAGRTTAMAASRFVIRNAGTAAGLTTQDRLNYDGIWNIEGIKETKEGRNRYLELTCTRNADT